MHWQVPWEAVELDAAVECVTDLKLPDTSSLSYAPSDDKSLPKLDRDFPQLTAFSDRVPELSGYANKLRAVMNEIKIANCESDTTKYDQAWTV